MKPYPLHKISRPQHLWFTIVFLACFVIFPGESYAEKVKAMVDRTQLSLGESVQFSVSITGNDGDVDVTAILDFQVISRGTSSSVQMINGRTSREIRYNYTLLPLREGQLTIPELKVFTGSQTLLTKAIEIRVTKDAVSASDRRDVYVEADVSEHQPFLGQQITYRFRLLNAVPVSNARYQAPEFKGFISREIEKRKSYRRVVSGKKYAVVELAYVLTPLETGDLTIGPSTLEAGVARTGQNNRRRSFGFDDFFRSPFSGGGNFQQGLFRTEPIAISVKPLPEYEDPAAFSGLVGVFDFKAELDPLKSVVGDSVTLTYTVQGVGNIRDAEAPELHVPDDIKIYRDEPEEEVILTHEGYQGRKIFRTALVPVKPGSYTWQPLQLVYFDTDRKAYVKHTQPLAPLVIEPADQEETYSAAAEGPQSTAFKQPVRFKDRDMLPIKDGLSALEGENTLSAPVFVLLLAVPACGYLFLVGLIRFTRRDDQPAAVMAHRSRSALKAARQQGVSNQALLSFLNRALISAVFARAGVMGESMTYAEVEHLLSAAGCPKEDVRTASALLELIDTCNYSGSDMPVEQRKKLLADTRELVRRVLK